MELFAATAREDVTEREESGTGEDAATLSEEIESGEHAGVRLDAPGDATEDESDSFGVATFGAVVGALFRAPVVGMAAVVAGSRLRFCSRAACDRDVAAGSDAVATEDADGPTACRLRVRRATGASGELVRELESISVVCPCRTFPAVSRLAGPSVTVSSSRVASFWLTSP